MRIILMIIISLSLCMAETTMIKDPSTNLLWEDTEHSRADKLSHDAALKYCTSLTLGEVSVWRLPTVHELLSIVDYTRYEPATLKEFDHVQLDSFYWTTTPYLRAKNKFWGVDFKDGSTSHASKSYNRHVRCVKDLD